MSTDEVTNQVVKVVDAIIEHHARQTIAQNYNKFKQIHTSMQEKSIQIIGGCCLFQL